MRKDNNPRDKLYKELDKLETAIGKLEAAGDGRADNECWPWSFGKKPNGYGHMYFDGDYKAYPHRVAYSLYCGEIPSGLEVSHNCDNRLCVNPAHLQLRTHAENMADMFSKNRHAFGTRNGQVKITESDVHAIRRSKEPLETLSLAFGLGIAQISRIRNYKRWGWLPKEA